MIMSRNYFSMKSFFHGLFVVLITGQAALADGPSAPEQTVVEKETAVENVSVAAPTSSAPEKISKVRREKAKTPNRKIVSTSVKKERRAAPESKFFFEEAKNLLVPNQKYLVKYEDEDSYGRLATNGSSSLTLTFSPDDVEKFRTAVQTIADYRTQMRQRCLGSSARAFTEALDQYLVSLCSFNRRALPLVGDISENNNTFVLLVNRTPLVDAPVLVSRYLQFKKQRFKENMGKFLPMDNQLVAAMVNIANVLKVEISDEEWNKSYGVRDNALELTSLWPREPIFGATERLSDLKEIACIVEAPGGRLKQAKEEASVPRVRAAE
jgi:hypothetical protein